MHCLRGNLSNQFDSIDTQVDIQILVNAPKDKADDTNWRFEPETITISNNSYWKGLFPRDADIQNNTLTLYFGGFWKKFTKNESGDVMGTTHPFELPVFARNKATAKELDGFGKAILLEYIDPPYGLFSDVLKIVDESTILGKAFLGSPSLCSEILIVSMSKKYPFEFMTEEDHEMLYSKMKKTALQSMIGIWEGQLVSDSTWSDVVFRFKYYFDEKDQKSLKNDGFRADCASV